MTSNVASGDGDKRVVGLRGQRGSMAAWEGLI